MQTPRARRRRDRRGRGLRGPICPREVPLARSRAQRFDDLVLDAIDRLERRWPAELRGVEVAVEDVPPATAVGTDLRPVPLARAFAATRDLSARIVVYRRPVEARAAEPRELAVLVHDVVVEQVAELLGLEPEQVDPKYGERDD
ncbi:MAG: metallopeptidase family protein [Actinomycetota bacterium]|nr:metallopeptidase family protein [Actinomycetota bacterium]